MPKFIKVPKEDYPLIVQRKLNKESLSDIAKDYQVSSARISQILSKIKKENQTNEPNTENQSN